MECIQGAPSLSPVPTQKYEKIVNSGPNSDNYYGSEINASGIHHPANCAVYIRNVCKSYGNGPPVLNNLCMNVKKGIIYGLLGSSGCGKTTILSCVVGLSKWGSGNLLVFGREPGTRGSGIPGKRLGYMPQDLALYNQLSIREAIQFYGRIYNMTSNETGERWTHLNKLLELPDNLKKIGDLSGGQKRRVSLALALIHSPELLILDEPTVGLDPLLRRNIWNHLYKLVKELGTTIIITTHYIEEARLSNTIGVMRKGRLLIEDTPSNLLSFYNCNLLEQVVLQLCRKDEDHESSPTANYNIPIAGVVFRSSWNGDVMPVATDDHDITNIVFRKISPVDSSYIKNNQRESIGNQGIGDAIRNSELCQSFRRIYGMTAVIFHIFTRYPLLLALVLISPSIQGCLTLWSLGHDLRGMHFGIVNHELTNWTRECDLSGNPVNSCDLTALSCKFLTKFQADDLVILDPYDNETAALDAVHLGNIWGYLTFPPNYSQHNLDLVGAGRFAANESIEGSRIHVHLDQSQYVASLLMTKHLYISYMDYITQLGIDCNLGGQLEIPLFFRTPVYGKIDDDFTAFIMPGVMVSALMLIVGILTAVIFISDRKQGTMSRARVAGLTTVDVMTSYLISLGIFITVGQVVIWNGALRFVFQFQIVGSSWLFMGFCAMAGLCGAALGILFGVLCNDEVEATVAGIFLTPICFLFGGVFWPTENMTVFWQWAGAVLPTTLPTLSLRSVVVRGMGLSNPLVWPGLVVLLGWTVVLVMCSAVGYRKLCKI